MDSGRRGFAGGHDVAEPGKHHRKGEVEGVQAVAVSGGEVGHRAPREQIELFVRDLADFDERDDFAPGTVG